MAGPRRPQPTSTDVLRTSQAIRAWLVRRLAAASDQPGAPFDAQHVFHPRPPALDLMCDDLAAWLAGSVPTELVGDYPTLDALAERLATGALVTDVRPRAAVRRRLARRRIGTGRRVRETAGRRAPRA
jgi:hypothetical protein